MTRLSGECFVVAECFVCQKVHWSKLDPKPESDDVTPIAVENCISV